MELSNFDDCTKFRRFLKFRSLNNRWIAQDRHSQKKGKLGAISAFSWRSLARARDPLWFRFSSSRNSQISTVAKTKFGAQKDAMKIIIPLADDKARFRLMSVLERTF
jgi:hypothetical protein